MDLQQIDNLLMNLSDEDLDSVADVVADFAFINKPTKIRKLELMLTEDCQFICDYCFVQGKNGERKMDRSTAISAVDLLLHEAAGTESIEITLFGGEPLLEFDLIREVVEYVEKKLPSDQSVIWALTTNGASVDEQKLQFFQKHGLRLLLSIDGNRESQDAHRRLASGGSTFDLVYPKIALMKKHQPWLGARVTVNPDTAGHMKENVEFLLKAGINQFIIGPNMDVMWTRDAFEVYRQQWFELANFYVSEWEQGRGFRITSFEKDLASQASECSGKWGCEAGRDKICVSTTGAIFPCTKFASQNYLAGKYKLGDLSSGITPRMRLFELQDNRVTIRGRCLSCDYADYCTGGCPADNLNKTGSIYMPSESDCAFQGIHVDLHSRVPGLSTAHLTKSPGSSKKAVKSKAVRKKSSQAKS